MNLSQARRTSSERRRVTNPNGQTTTVEQNSLGQNIRVTDPAGGLVEYLYDAMGRLLQTKSEEQVNGVRTKLVTLFEYDALGRKTKMTDPNMGVWEYGYNVFSELSWQKDAKGNLVTSKYDILGRKIEQVANVPDANAPPGTLKIEERTEWVYDSYTDGTTIAWKGAALCTKHYAGTALVPKLTDRVASLDSLGRPLSTTRSYAGKTFTSSNTYDAYGRPETYTYPTGVQTRNTYAALGYLSKIENAAFNTVYWEIQDMDANGRITSQKLGNGLVSTSTFDPKTGALKELRTGDVQHNQYEFDPLGNLKSRTELRYGSDVGVGTPAQKVETFTYDSLNRLATSTVTGQAAKSYSYSIGGNLLSKAGLTYQYQGFGPHAVSSVSGLFNGKYAYDSNGSMTRSEVLGAGGIADPAQTRLFTYAWHNKPTRITKGSAVAVDYEYGPGEGRICQTEIDGTSTSLRKRRTYYSGSYELIEDYDNATLNTLSKTTQRHYIGGVAILNQVLEPGKATVVTTDYPLSDHLGSTEVITNSFGVVTERTSFDAFGHKRNANTWADNAIGTIQPRSAFTSHGYTGHEELESVGLIHMGGRVYDPVLGRVTSADPIVQAPSNLQSYNRYSYCINNPLSLTDPSGYSWFGNFFKSVANHFKSEFKRITNWVKKNWRLIVVAVVTIVVAVVAPYAAGALTCIYSGGCVGLGVSAGAAVTVGAVGGAIIGGASAAIYGGSAKDILKGALIGAVSGALTAGIGHAIPWGTVAGVAGEVGAAAGKAALHGVAQGAMSELAGGDFTSGFLGGAVGSVAGSLMDYAGGMKGFFGNAMRDRGAGGVLLRTSMAAVVGGSAAALGGGSFTNGAVSAAFVHLFNSELGRLRLADQAMQEASDIGREKEGIIAAAKKWNQTSPAWASNNQCGAQSAALRLYVELTVKPQYFISYAVGGSSFIENHQVTEFVASEAAQSYGFQNFVLDGFKARFGRNSSGVVTEITPFEFLRQYGRPHRGGAPSIR